MFKTVYLLLFVILIVPFTKQKSALGQHSGTIKESSYTSSKVCARCHKDIYRKWQRAMHAMSLQDPIFKAAYMEAYTNTNGEAKYLCLRCHAPTTYANKDYDLKLDVTKEGVTCDFCHTVMGVDLNNNSNPFKIELGLIKRGPLRGKEVSSPAHKVKYSNLHESSLLCAGCHEYKNEDGLSILSTYSEWKAGPYAAAGKQCQSCHMPLRVGKVVSPEIKELKGQEINEHDLSGGHSVARVREAIKVEIVEIKRYPKTLWVTVKATNSGSGHMVPTGLPTRRMVLKVTAETANRVLSQEEIYGKFIYDADGNEIIKDCEIMTKGVRIAKDNRIAPGQSSQKVFIFPIPSQVSVTITAQANYLYKPLLLQEMEMEIEMGRDVRSVTGKPSL